MYIPDFVFEEEDILVLKKNNIFLSEFTDKISGTVFFKINDKTFNRLIDLLYENKVLDRKNKADLEFDLKTVVYIFTLIIDKKAEADKPSILQLILEYHRINPLNSKKLMSCFRFN